jgi:anti-sigma factor (TIGR02949 family)
MNHHEPSNCQETLQKLNAYIDGELNPQLCSQLEAHMASCSDCQIVYNTLKKTIQLCKSDGERVNLPPDARQRLLASLGLDAEDDDG